MQISTAISSAFARDLGGVELRVAQQRRRRGLRVRAAAADRGNPLVGFDHVAGSGEHEQMLGIADDHERLQAAQRAILPPVLGQLDGGSRQVLELARTCFRTSRAA